VGLFARFFLDAVQELCACHGKDYYDRLCYVAADHSEQMLLDACRYGLFAQHPGRYILRVVNALHPAKALAQDAAFGELSPRPFRAVFLNYLLACLPAAVLQIDGSTARQLYVRTCLARGIEPKTLSEERLDELLALAGSADPNIRGELLRDFGLLASEYDFRPVEPDRLPYGNFAVHYCRSNTLDSVVHNFGAIQCLECMRELVREGGFILVNDYGKTQVSSAASFQHQRFSHSTAVGLNFPLLKAYFGGEGQGQWIEAAEEKLGVPARLWGCHLAPESRVFTTALGGTPLTV
jgi:hypothetical protein